MSLFNRRYFIACLGITGLTGCGFSPVYQAGTIAAALQNNIIIDVEVGRYNFELRQKLLERFGQANNNPAYRMKFDLAIESTDLVISSDAQIDRYNLTGVVHYTITSTKTGRLVFSDRVKSFTAYGATAATYPTQIAERDANIRLSHSLANLMVRRISSTVRGWKQ